METEIAVPQDFGLAVARDPKAVIAEAKRAADSLKAILDAKPKETWVMMNNERYLEYEDWATVAKFYGVTAKVVSTNPVDIGGVRGWEARAVAFHNPSGIEVSAADSMCLQDEDKWSTRTKYEWKDELDANGKKIWVEGKDGKKGHYRGKREKVGEVAVPAFQLRSMAQTRACAKVLKNVFSWVVVLAGFKPQVAEEMTGDETVDKPKAEPIKGPEAAKPPEIKPEDKKEPPKSDGKTESGENVFPFSFVPERSSAKATKKEGQTRYAILNPNVKDEWLATFSDDLGKIAVSARENKQTLAGHYKMDGAYKTIVDCEIK